MMRYGVLLLVAAAVVCVVAGGECRADSSRVTDESVWRLAVSGSYGLVSTFQADQSGWDLTPQRKGGYPEPAVSVGVRFARIPPGHVGFRSCVDLSFYYFSVPLSTYRTEVGSSTVTRHHLGYVRGRWVVVTPGWQRVTPDGNGLCWFVGLAGAGFAVNGFGTNPYLEGDAAEAASRMDVHSGLILAIIPAKVEWMFAGRYSAGVSFSGVLLSKPTMKPPPDSGDWKAPSGDELNLSNVHLHATFGIWIL